MTTICPFTQSSNTAGDAHKHNTCVFIPQMFDKHLWAKAGLISTFTQLVEKSYCGLAKLSMELQGSRTAQAKGRGTQPSSKHRGD